MIGKIKVFLQNGLSIKRSGVKEYAIASMGIVALMLIPFGQLLADKFTYEAPEAMKEIVSALNGGASSAFFLTVFSVCILAPLLEELLFRGVVWSYVSRKLNNNYAFIVTTILFIAAHRDPAHMAGILPLSIWLGFVRYKAGSVLPCIFAHALNNIIISICIITS